MIQKLNFPTEIEKPLLRASAVQLNILLYASSVTSTSQSDCTDYLVPIYGSKAAKIAEWAFAVKDRCQALNDFAQAQGTPAEKRAFIQLLKAEQKRFSHPEPQGELIPFSTHEANCEFAAPANRYLKEGYTALGTAQGLPAEVAGEKIQRYRLILAFRTSNPNLVICPACDGARQTDVVDPKKPLASLDHFLPQREYPHLALHPRNLVPVCAACNSFKHERDPLLKVQFSQQKLSAKARAKAPAGAGFSPTVSRRLLQDIRLPYDCRGWKEGTAMQVELVSATVARFVDVLPKPGNDGELKETIAMHRDAYKVTERWGNRTDEIGSRMIRRARQFFLEAQLQYSDDQTLAERLDCLLGYAYEDIGREPDAYALTWWLAALADPRLSTAGKTAFIDEIKDWLQDNQQHHQRFRAAGQELRQRLP